LQGFGGDGAGELHAELGEFLAHAHVLRGAVFAVDFGDAGGYGVQGLWAFRWWVVGNG
jgi:hypothetical protein